MKNGLELLYEIHIEDRENKLYNLCVLHQPFLCNLELSNKLAFA